MTAPARLELVAGPDYWAFRADMKRRQIVREERSERMRIINARRLGD